MKYETYPDVVCFGDIKQAAFFFDRVISQHVQEELIENIVLKKIDGKTRYKEIKFKSSTHEEVFNDLTFGHKFADAARERKEQYKERYATFLAGLHLVLLDIITAKQDMEELALIAEKGRGRLLDYYIDNKYLPIERMNYRDYYHRLLSIMDIKTSSIILPVQCGSEIDNDSTDVSVVLSGLPLVDSSKITWEEIIEIRKNKAALRKLRNLRLFLYANYQDKPRSFIEDDILKRLEDFRSTCKENGLQTCLSCLSVTLNSKSLMASAVAGISAAFFGGPIAGLGAVVMVEAGHLSLELVKGFVSYKKLRNDHELAYIFDLSKRLG